MPRLTTAPLVGRRAPAFALQSAAGRRVSLADLHGQRVLLVFVRHLG